MAVHPYAFPSLPSDEDPDSPNGFAVLPAVHDLMLTHGVTGRVWATEYGAPTGTSRRAVSEGVQAALVTEGFEALAAQGTRFAVATSKRRETARLALSGVGIEHLIDVAAALEDTTKHKPDPEPLLHAAAVLQVAPADCVYVGDAVVDMEAARAAGMAAVAVTWGAGERPALEAARPDALCTTIGELTAYLLPQDGSRTEAADAKHP